MPKVQWLGGAGGMPPREFLCSEINSVAFWDTSIMVWQAVV